MMLPIHLIASLALTVFTAVASAEIRVVVWDEQQPAQKKAYDNFIGNTIAARLKNVPGLSVKSVNLNEPEQGLSKETLDNCDVLIWWGHLKHGAVSQEKAQDIVDRIKAGKLSMITLHSALDSRPFGLAMEERAKIGAAKALSEAERKNATLTPIRTPRKPVKTGEKPTPFSEIIRKPDGTVEVKLTLPTCVIAGWKEEGKPSHVTITAPEHPITKGIPAQFDLPQTEMYKEPWEVPPPDAVIFEERWDSGEHFRGGCVWELGKGKIFYFRPGHETYPVYKEKLALQIIENAVLWLGVGK
jgi:trehalose utilization protein